MEDIPSPAIDLEIIPQGRAGPLKNTSMGLSGDKYHNGNEKRPSSSSIRHSRQCWRRAKNSSASMLYGNEKSPTRTQHGCTERQYQLRPLMASHMSVNDDRLLSADPPRPTWRRHWCLRVIHPRRTLSGRGNKRLKRSFCLAAFASLPQPTIHAPTTTSNDAGASTMSPPSPDAESTSYLPCSERAPLPLPGIVKPR